MGTETAPDTNLDLGVNIEIPTENLFESFYKAQDNAAKTGKPADTTIKGKSSTDDDDDPDEPADKSKTKTAPVDPQFKTDDVLDMAKKKTLGKEEDDDNDEKPKPPGNKDKTKPSPIPEGVFKTFYEHFTSELGYRELEEGQFDGSEEKFLEMIELNKEEDAQELAESMIEEAFLKTPQNIGPAKDLFQFLRNGGTVDSFIETRKYDDITAEYLSSTDDDDEKTDRATEIMTKHYQSMGWEDDAITKLLKPLQTSGAIIATAEATLPQFIKQRDLRKTIADKTAITEKTNRENNIKQYNNKLLSLIDTVKEVGAFSLKTPKEIQAAKEYMFMPTVQVGDRMVPQYVVDYEKARQNPLFTLYQALSLKHKGVNLEGLKETIANNEKANLKSKLEQTLAGSKTEQASAASAGSQSQHNRTPVTEFLDFDKLSFA